ncbi:hypothetical protein AAGV28_14825 [Flavobacterium sp. FZUC8N2.13]|uniref:Uncharacterized protein n=1 Tax=Flavobacterium zubiriense TaxID=3138075 RepID=A0ABV4THT6_9FLAO
MENKSLIRKLNFIEIYQFFGGIIGLLIMVYLLTTTNVSEYKSFFNILLILPFIFFTFCIYSAWLINRKKYLRGLNLILISFFFQLFAFDLYGVFYTSVNGLAINLILDLTDDILVRLDFQPSQFLLVFKSGTLFYFKLNLVALGMFIFTSKILKELKDNVYVL